MRTHTRNAETECDHCSVYGRQGLLRAGPAAVPPLRRRPQPGAGQPRQDSESVSSAPDGAGAAAADSDSESLADSAKELRCSLPANSGAPLLLPLLGVWGCGTKAALLRLEPVLGESRSSAAALLLLEPGVRRKSLLPCAGGGGGGEGGP